jgi:dTDP-L-rhamnose 4-epimerase
LGETVLITGGAGFIGRWTAKALLKRGYEVRILDSLIEQAHPGSNPPADLPREAELVVGDVRDANAVLAALRGVDKVIHLAAEVGVGQSMYAIDRYTSVNDYGTAVLFQQLIERPVKRVVTASSMSIYGEGLYRDADGGLHETVAKPVKSETGSWDPLDDQGRPLAPLPTPETKRPTLASVYALGKYMQERLTLTVAPSYGMEGAALRLFNVYGPGQALSNPYTGVLAIFAARLLHDRAPMVFEDGRQRRDFVHVEDAAQAFVLALEHPNAPGRAFNIGSGNNVSIAEVAQALARAMGKPIEPEILDQARAGDIRHCFADVSLAERMLGFKAKKDFHQGLHELAAWLEAQEAEDKVPEARRELEARGLVAS